MYFVGSLFKILIYVNRHTYTLACGKRVLQVHTHTQIYLLCQCLSAHIHTRVFLLMYTHTRLQTRRATHLVKYDTELRILRHVYIHIGVCMSSLNSQPALTNLQVVACIIKTKRCFLEYDDDDSFYYYKEWFITLD